eukprot:3154007-Rhodomonas_salina.2
MLPTCIFHSVWPTQPTSGCDSAPPKVAVTLAARQHLCPGLSVGIAGTEVQQTGFKGSIVLSTMQRVTLAVIRKLQRR